jgi:hypothetical protein
MPLERKPFARASAICPAPTKAICLSNILAEELLVALATFTPFFWMPPVDWSYT